MTKKQKINNKKKKIIVIVAFLLFLLLASSITTVTVLNITNNNELGSSEGNILYYNEDKKQEENNVLIVGIDEKNEENEKPETEEPEETNEANQTKTDNNKDNKTTNNNTKKVVDTPYYIKVNYKSNVVTVYKKDDSGKYTKAVKAMVCSCGDYTPPCNKYPDTVYKIPGSKYTWLNLQDGVCGQYATRITGHILFHSVPYTKKDKSALEYWEYDKLGEKASAGCIRLTVKDAKWIYDNIPAGTCVEFYGDSNPGPLGKPTAQKISSDTEVRGWDPTDPDKANPWPAYLKKKEEAAAAAKAAEEASTKPMEDKTNTTNKTQETNTTPVENKTAETTKNNDIENKNATNNTNTNTTKPAENKVSTNQI